MDQMKADNNKQIEKFLFGELPVEELFAFEESIVENVDLFEQTVAVEDGLIEKYHRGWMDASERAKFEKHFLSTRKRKERVENWRQFIQGVDEQREIAAVIVSKETVPVNDGNSFWDRVATLFLSPKIAMAGVSVVILMVVAGWFVINDRYKTTPEIAKDLSIVNSAVQTPILTPDQPDTPNDIDAKISDDKAPNGEGGIDPKESESLPIERPKDDPPPMPTNTPVKKVERAPVLALFSGRIRSDGNGEVLNLPKEAKTATLQLNLEQLDYKTFQAVLTDANGTVMYQKDNLKVKGSRINFVIPAGKLSRGDYIIRVSGKTSDAQNEDVADFQFRINK